MTFTLTNLTVPSCITSTYLFANITDRTWQSTVRMEHVSGEFFVAMTAAYDLEGFDNETPLKAEFRLGEGGGVKWVGMVAEPMMGDEKIWFERV